jgi:hypothetical protein
MLRHIAPVLILILLLTARGARRLARRLLAEGQQFICF